MARLVTVLLNALLASRRPLPESMSFLESMAIEDHLRLLSQTMAGYCALAEAISSIQLALTNDNKLRELEHNEHYPKVNLKFLFSENLSWS